MRSLVEIISEEFENEESKEMRKLLKKKKPRNDDIMATMEKVLTVENYHLLSRYLDQEVEEYTEREDKIIQFTIDFMKRSS